MSVGPFTGPVQRPSDERDLSEIFGRVEALERVRRASGAGLQYDTDNEGDWFYAAANDTTGAPNIGYEDAAGNVYAAGFSWQFDTGTSGAPFAITNDGGFTIDTFGTIRILGGSGIEMETFGSGISVLTDGGGLTINQDDGAGGFGLTNWDTGGLDIETHGGNFDLDTGDGGFTLQTGTGSTSITSTGITVWSDDDISISLATGKKFTVKDHLGNPKIEWTEGTNDLHIPTGGTIVADL